LFLPLLLVLAYGRLHHPSQISETEAEPVINYQTCVVSNEDQIHVGKPVSCICKEIVTRSIYAWSSPTTLLWKPLCNTSIPKVQIVWLHSWGSLWDSMIFIYFDRIGSVEYGREFLFGGGSLFKAVGAPDLRSRP
jgi:hypothetical protein